MQPTLLILAAGIGSRYGGLKQVDGMGPSGEAILEYSVHHAIKAGFGKVYWLDGGLSTWASADLPLLKGKA